MTASAICPSTNIPTHEINHISASAFHFSRVISLFSLDAVLSKNKMLYSFDLENKVLLFKTKE